MSVSCDICKYMSDDGSEVLKTDYWRVSLAPDQGYLGRCYVALRQHKGSLSDLTSEEWHDFAHLAPSLEKAVGRSFGATPFNWACMMNNAYQLTQAEPHVHWHFRPRYKLPVTVKGVKFSDPLYGHHYDRKQRNFVDDAVYKNILTLVKNNLN